MPGKACPGKTHTPIVSEKQRKFFGAELGRKRAGKRTKTGMSEATLREHLKEGVVKRTPQGSRVFSNAEVGRGYRVVG